MKNNKIKKRGVNEVIETTAWMNGFMRALNENFGERVWFVGLQGSYGRGEATEKSDTEQA